MSYSYELEKKQLVIEAGNLLSERGLVERTWGNVSVRIDGEYFAISPTGASYSSLVSEDIPVVNIKDLTFIGRRKPSSELFIHSYIYDSNPDVSFILHTHQRFASLMSLFFAGKSGSIETSSKYKNILGKSIPVVEYTKAGTQKIAENIIKILSSKMYKSVGIVLMAAHGLVCFANNFNEAFNTAQELENFAKKVILNQLKKNGFFLELNGKLHTYTKNTIINNTLPTLINKLCSLIFEYFSNLSFITLSTLPISKYISKMIDIHTFPYITESLQGIPAYFDDAAQIIGESAIVISETKDIDSIVRNAQSLFTRFNALIVANVGVLFFSQKKDETIYMASIFEKNAFAFLLSLHNPNIVPLEKENANALHTSFIQTYSKLKNS